MQKQRPDITTIGIDPGIANTAICTVTAARLGCYSLEDAKLVKSTAAQQTGARLTKIHEALLDSIQKIRFCDAIVIEKVFHNKNVTSSLSTGAVIGICHFVAHDNEIPVIELTPQQIKKVSGRGYDADKEMLIRGASGIFKKRITSHHIADAALAALAGCLTRRGNSHGK